MFDFEDRRDFADFRRDVGAAHFSDPKRIADIVPDRLMRIERVALKHHRDVAIARLQLRHIPFADQDPPFGRHVEPCENAQRRGLTASGRPEQRHERAIRHLQVEGMERRKRVESLADALVGDRAHRARLAKLSRSSASDDTWPRR